MARGLKPTCQCNTWGCMKCMTRFIQRECTRRKLVKKQELEERLKKERKDTPLKAQRFNWDRMQPGEKF